MLRRLLLLSALVAGLTASGAGVEPRFDRVTVAPAKTSIYVGTVSLTMPAFIRKDGGYESTYQAKVFPYFFSNEGGRLRIEISDAQLTDLTQGRRIQFQGRAVRDDGVARRLEGSALPADAANGALTVRVVISKRIQLIFHTTYRFEPSPRG
jgi:hypothetical protein